MFPPLEDAGLERTWAGLYEMTPDRHPILGPAPGLEGFYLANGFSGHGFQHAPIVGKLLAEMVTEGAAPRSTCRDSASSASPVAS